MAEHIGVISDTHGLLREQARDVLWGCTMIIHAGDIGSRAVLTELRQIAEVVAVRGNMDGESWANELKDVEALDVGGRRICVVHNIGSLTLDETGGRPDVIIFGHSHQPVIERRNGILYLNPGSAGPRRFHLPVSIARLRIGAEGVFPELVEL